MKSILAGLLLLQVLLGSCKDDSGNYVCTPCNQPCDELAFTTPGTCPHCQMKLVKKEDLVPEKSMVLNQIALEPGSGQFLIEGGSDKEKIIEVHYHMPSNLEPDSKVLFVLPGAGRNGDDYRDAWITNSEKYRVLILALAYSENHYPGFWNYNLGGMLKDVNVRNKTYTVNENPSEWIYNDFDRIFDEVRKEMSLTRKEYDMFGHSAGGQLLHRFTIFNPANKAGRILASNSGWYTLPTEKEVFPYGLQGVRVAEGELETSFGSKLILFLGEKDNADETRGDIRHTPEADRQGLHRLARGTYFFDQSKRIAKGLHFNFNWQLEIVPDTGHDYRGMSQAAAEFLYADQN